jgi:hypothetical protein
MFNLTDILQAAQGGEAVANLARQFHISQQQALAAIQALTPALSTGLAYNAQDPAGLSSILSHMMSGQHKAAFEDPNAAKTDATAAAGQDALAQMFGAGAQATQQIANHAAQISGVSAAVIQQMLPVIASMVMGGLMTAMQNHGLGGVFSELGSLAQKGGFGSILGQMFGQPGAAPGAGGPTPGAQKPPPMPDMGAIFGNVLSGMFGGAKPSAPAQGAAPQPDPPQQPAAAGGLDPTSVEAGLDALSKMFNHGAQMSAAHQQAWADVLGQVFQQKKT